MEGLPPARQEDCKIHIGKRHYQNRLEHFARELCGRFPFIKEVYSDEWQQGEEQVKAELPNVLIVGSRLKTDILFRLRLVTIAANPGQLGAAKRTVERYMAQKRG